MLQDLNNPPLNKAIILTAGEFRIVFMGTPAFAVPSLGALLRGGYDVVGVVTAPDKPAGRGLQLQSSPVKHFAQEQGLSVLQPISLKDPDFIEQLHELRPHLIVVVAFRMLPEQVWSMPPKGTINLHASLLPQYRGAAPIHHAIINGETSTGLTTFFINRDIDTGHIIRQLEQPIGPDMTAGELHDILMDTGAGLLLDTVHAIREDRVTTTPQSTFLPAGVPLKTAPKLRREDARIDWSRTVEEVYNKIRGLSPSPASFTELLSPEGQALSLKVYSAARAQWSSRATPGALVVDGRRLLAACQDGWLELLELQLAGKRRMPARELLHGLALSDRWQTR